MRGRDEEPVTGSYPPPGDEALRGPARFLWWLVVSQRWRVLLGAALGTLWMVGLVLPPYLLSRAIDDGLRPREYSSLVGWVAVLLLVGVLNAFVGIMRHRTMTKVRMDGAFRTLSAVVMQSTRLGNGLAAGTSAGEVTTIGIGDVWVMSTSLTVVGPGVGAVIAYIVVAGLLLNISPVLALVILLGVPVIALLVGPPLGRLRSAGSVYRNSQGELTSSLVDIVQGLRVLNGTGGKELLAARYRQKSQDLRDEGYRVGKFFSWVPSLGSGLPLLFLAVVTWLAAIMAVRQEISIGDLVAVYGYVAVLAVPVAELIESSSNLAQAMVSAERVTALLRVGRDAADSAGSLSGAAPAAPAGFHDPESGVEIAHGRLTALAGARPEDAAAVIDRLGRFVTSRATWGDTRLDHIALGDFRTRVLVADNEADIFSGSLRDIVAGRFDSDDSTVAGALSTAVADDIVQGLPDGLASAIEAQARNLSGGQRQRVRLARALLAEPEVLLAAEPTSAVDANTEAVIADRLRAARSGATTVVSTTSPLLLDRADVVHHLVDGQVAASGTHRELLERHADYRRLVSRGMERGDESASDPRPEHPLETTKATP